MDPNNPLIGAALEVTKDIVPEVYKDGVQPTVKELGKNLHTVSKLVTVALAPVSAVVWGYDQVKTFLQASLERKLQKVPQENIIPPDLTVAGPSIDALRYSGHKEELRELFTNLLATAMDSSTAPKAHPSFVDILKQINPDEARILKLLDSFQSKPIVKLRVYNTETNHYNDMFNEFSMLPYEAGCSHPELGPSYLVNISRLGLANIDYDTFLTIPNAYTPVSNHPLLLDTKKIFEDRGYRVEVKQGIFTRTPFGQTFYETCVLDK